MCPVIAQPVPTESREWEWKKKVILWDGKGREEIEEGEC
jgi:hypothetical protein